MNIIACDRGDYYILRTSKNQWSVYKFGSPLRATFNTIDEADGYIANRKRRDANAQSK